LPLAAYALTVAWHARDKVPRWAAVAGAVGTMAAGVMMYATSLPAPRVTNLYDVVFFGILPESKTPAADLRTLGLDPAYVRYSGTLAWTAGTGVGDGFLVNALQAKVTPLSLLLFYVARPARMWQHTRAALLVAFSLRPEFCGNFDRSAGRFPGARSHAVALWSHFHERYLSKIGAGLLAALILGPIGCTVLLWTRNVTPGFRRWAEMGICLSTCCLMAFVAAAFGDTWDTVKHLFLFNLLLDACLVFVAGAIWTGAFAAQRPGGESEH
jgi:hypothetical protein